MSPSLKHRIALLAAALWWGSLTALGSLVVPALFAHLPTPALAGQTAAKLFTLQSYASAACSVLVILLVKPPGRPRSSDSSPSEGSEGQNSRSNSQDVQVNSSSVAINFAITGLLLALLIELAVAPRILVRENLALWHGIGTAMFAAQWAMALGALWRLSKPGG